MNSMFCDSTAAFDAINRAIEQRNDLQKAFAEARDSILHDRGPLEGAGLEAEQTNAVLAIIDDAFKGLV